MIGRILFFLILGLLGYLVYRSFVTPKDGNRVATRKPDAVDDMVVCVRCGVNIPRQDAQAVPNGLACQDADACGHAPKG